MEYLYSFIRLLGGHFLVSIFHINSYVPMFIKTYIASKLDIKVNSGFIDCSYASGTMFSENDSVIGGCVCVCVCVSLSRVQLFATPWTVACQALLSMEFSRQGSWSMLPFPSLGDLLDSGIEPRSPSLKEDALPSE